MQQGSGTQDPQDCSLQELLVLWAIVSLSLDQGLHLTTVASRRSWPIVNPQSAVDPRALPGGRGAFSASHFLFEEKKVSPGCRGRVETSLWEYGSQFSFLLST